MPSANNATTWQGVTYATFREVVWSPTLNMWVAVNNTGCRYMSVDGTTWRRVREGPTYQRAWLRGPSVAPQRRTRNFLVEYDFERDDHD